MNRIKTTLANRFIRYCSNDERFFKMVMERYKEKLEDEYFHYPSYFNKGYLHIGRMIKIAKSTCPVSQNAIIIDVGAANGSVSALFSEYFPQTEIFSFEPIKETFAKLSENVNGNKNIHIHNTALGAEKGNLKINKACRITSSSLFHMKKEVSNEFFSANLKEAGEEIIKISTMDDEVPRNRDIIIIKIDVQGYEIEVLRGGLNTLRRSAFILLEMQNHDLYVGAPPYYEVDKFLRSKGFELYDIIPSIREDYKLYEWDAIYRNKSL